MFRTEVGGKTPMARKEMKHDIIPPPPLLLYTLTANLRVLLNHFVHTRTKKADSLRLFVSIPHTFRLTDRSFDLV